MGQAVRDFKLWSCCSVGCRGANPRVVDGGRLAICSLCIVVPLRRYVQCLVWWNQAGFARDSILRSGVRLLLFASNLFVGFDQGITPPCLFCAVSPFYCVAERRATERSRVAPTCAR